jgi:hypothetical protein
MICTIRSKLCCVYNGISSPYLVLHRPIWSTDVPLLREAVEKVKDCERLSHRLMRCDQGRHTINKYMEGEKRVLACCNAKPSVIASSAPQS